MKTAFKSLLTLIAVAIDPLATFDFYRWNKKRHRKQQEAESQKIQANSPWPPPQV